MYTNRGPEVYATAQGLQHEGEAALAAARGEGRILAPPVKPYSFRRGVLFSLLTAPIGAGLVAVFGLNSPIAAVATTPFAIVISFALFAYGSGRSPVVGRNYVAASGIGIITMIVGILVSYPYSVFLSYVYADGAGGISGSPYATHFSTWIGSNGGQIFIPIGVVIVAAAVMLWRKARAARAGAADNSAPDPQLG
jgi:hypothetical protein